MLPVGSTVSCLQLQAWGTAAESGGGQWCRQSAALYSRPTGRGSKLGGVAPAEWRVQRTPNGALSMPGLGRASLRPATAGRRAVRRSSAGCHAGRGGRWTAGRTRPPPGFRRRYAIAADRRHACTPGRWPRRVWCLLGRCRRWLAGMVLPIGSTRGPACDRRPAGGGCDVACGRRPGPPAWG